MFRKYEKTYRLNGLPNNWLVAGKHVLLGADAKRLCNGSVVIEEKIDGANVGIIRHKNGYHLQKRGSLVSTSEHAQFQFFHNYAAKNYDKIMALPKGYIVYGELMYAVHQIYYDNLPDWFICFDIWNGNKYLNREEKENFCDLYEFELIAKIYEGKINVDDVLKYFPKKSAYGETIEGIVIKRYTKTEMLRAKIVDPKFIKRIEELGKHWTKQKITRNVVAN